MTKRIIAITFIFICASVAWLILGGTIFSRTYSLASIGEDHVSSTWGTPQNQAPPQASFTRRIPKVQETVVDGKKIVQTVEEEVVMMLPLERSAIDVALDLERLPDRHGDA
jgi:hypothetical protein